VNLEVEKGEFVTIIGPSGSGKTTFLNIIGGIDKPTKGRIIVFGEDLNVKDEDFLASFRCHNIDFVFQSYNLISTLTVSENIAFPMEWTKNQQAKLKAVLKNFWKSLAYNTEPTTSIPIKRWRTATGSLRPRYGK
jgi:putative ABC transport system ATP-binding protein